MTKPTTQFGEVFNSQERRGGNREALSNYTPPSPPRSSLGSSFPPPPRFKKPAASAQPNNHPLWSHSEPAPNLPGHRWPR
ncbi:unnamed protein product [Linum trigynum]|uniref:Uncharacterized protein n=1 Tax=Linum trigynum TaxID=586398 RepID=A0AAV2CFB5_9ROSI